MNRRQFLQRSTAVLGAAALGTAGYAHWLEPEALRVERVAVHAPGLPVHQDGYTIGVLADLHLGRFVQVERVHAAAEKLARARPDLVVVAGDFIGDMDFPGNRPPYANIARMIDQALAPVKGAYGVWGNWDLFIRRLPMGEPGQSVVRILVNEGALVAPGVWLGGIDDAYYGKPDVERALDGAPAEAVRILLAHEPDLADRVLPRHRVALQISGHSHAGQVRLPLAGPVQAMLPPLGRKYVAGLNQAPACPVYTTRGIGVVHLPFRFLCPPEITLITLRTT